MFKLVSQGAEAKLYKGEYEGKQLIVKERFPKQYRHKLLNERLTKERLRAEIRGIQRAKAIGVCTPTIYFVDPSTNSIYMERFDDVETVNVTIGKILNEGCSNTCGSGDSSVTRENSELNKVGFEVGKTIGQLHDADIIHGDLTTSNILMKRNLNGDYEIIMIDFGLSHVEDSTENKGVDLYVLERALASTHSKVSWLFENILEAYQKYNIKDGSQVIKKLDEIRLRGRKRTMVG